MVDCLLTWFQYIHLGELYQIQRDGQLYTVDSDSRGYLSQVVSGVPSTRRQYQYGIQQYLNYVTKSTIAIRYHRAWDVHSMISLTFRRQLITVETFFVRLLVRQLY